MQRAASSCCRPPGPGQRRCGTPGGLREGWFGVSQRRFPGSVHYGVLNPLLNDSLPLHADKMISRLLSE